jgi:hypothetical protein
VSLAQKLGNVLDNGVRRVGYIFYIVLYYIMLLYIFFVVLNVCRSSLNLDEIESSWAGFYAKASAMINEQKDAIKAKENQKTAADPLVSVCITHYNRPQLLKLALESVEALEYPNFEVVLIDDGSTTQDAKEYAPYCLSCSLFNRW